MTISKKPGTPFFSVVIPTFNRWPLVCEAIESVLAQTFRSFELIVIDDGSTDNSATYIKERFKTVRVIKQPNKGVSAARNAGIASSKADWIALLDSDDLWEPGKLERQHEMIKTNPEVKALYTGEIWFRNGRRVNPARKHAKPVDGENSDDELFRRSLGLCLISPSSVVIHSEVFGSVGGFDESMPVCEDYDLWLRIMTRYRVWLLPEKLTIKRNAYGAKCQATQLSASTWGFDRYRVLSLGRLIASGALGAAREKWVLEEIVRKAGIVAEGSIKRGKLDEADRWLEEGRRAQQALSALCGEPAVNR